MKNLILLFVCASLAGAASSTELRIDSLNRNGLLTWTNSVSNATYRVEWAGSIEGPWNPFSALTNLDSIVASNTTVTATVPMFYRVVWTDPPVPQPVGDWIFNGYDAFGTLVVTGLVSIPTGYETNHATWSFGPVPNGTNTWSLPFCSAGAALVSLWNYSLNLFLAGANCPAEGEFYLQGTLLGDEYSGTWFQEGIVLNPLGQFVARRVIHVATPQSATPWSRPTRNQENRSRFPS